MMNEARKETNMTTPHPKLLPCPCKYCSIMPFVFSTNNPPHVIGGWMSMCGAVECKNPQAFIGKTKEEAIENWNAANSTPPAAPAEDAVEVLVSILNEYKNGKLVDCHGFAETLIKHLTAAGLTLRLETMTEAELERRARNIQVHFDGVLPDETVNEFINLAKEYRS